MRKKKLLMFSGGKKMHCIEHFCTKAQNGNFFGKKIQFVHMRQSI